MREKYPRICSISLEFTGKYLGLKLKLHKFLSQFVPGSRFLIIGHKQTASDPKRMAGIQKSIALFGGGGLRVQSSPKILRGLKYMFKVLRFSNFWKTFWLFLFELAKRTSFCSAVLNHAKKGLLIQIIQLQKAINPWSKLIFLEYLNMKIMELWNPFDQILLQDYFFSNFSQRF